MIVYINGLFSGQRPAFVPTFPIEAEAHRKSQCLMFGAAGRAGLMPRTKTEAEREAAKVLMLAGINQLLSLRLESRKQMTVQEMDLVTVAIEAGAFQSGWKLAPGFAARVQITITPVLSDVAADALATDTDAPDYAGYHECFFSV